MEVGQRAFQPVAHLDAHFSVVARHQKQDAVVLARLAETPCAEEAVGVGLDLLAAETRYRGDHDLFRRFLLERLELLDERGLGDGIDQSGVVDDASGQRRHVLGE